MAKVWERSAQFPLNHLSLVPQFMSTVFFASLLHTTSLPTAAWYIAMNAESCSFVSLACVVSLQIKVRKL